MFEQLPGNKQDNTSSFALKMVAFGACGLLLGIGVCGLGALVHRDPGSYFGVLSFLGLVILGLSTLTLVVGLLLLIFWGIIRLFGG